MPGRPVIRVAGDGPDLVMLHGWGMHRGVWGETASALARRYRLHLVDFPGHGEGAGEHLSGDLGELAATVAQQVPPAAWLGWSMGGLVTLQALLEHSAPIHRAVLVAWVTPPRSALSCSTQRLSAVSPTSSDRLASATE